MTVTSLEYEVVLHDQNYRGLLTNAIRTMHRDLTSRGSLPACCFACNDIKSMWERRILCDDVRWAWFKEYHSIPDATVPQILSSVISDYIHNSFKEVYEALTPDLNLPRLEIL